MRKVSTLKDFKNKVQDAFDNNKESMAAYGENHSTQLKAYLLETNNKFSETECPDGSKWKKLDVEDWYVNQFGNNPYSLFLDVSRERVWIVYSLLDSDTTKKILDKWISNSQGFDNCWLSRRQLLQWENRDSWTQRGFGFKFDDGLYSQENAGNFSLKGWYRPNRSIEGLDKIIEIAKENFAIHSARWEKRRDESTVLSSEWYSDGRVTINSAKSVEETLLSISEVASRYEDSLVEATKLRDGSMGAFELDFTQPVDLEAFSEKVMKGTGQMKLWLLETESEEDFKRYKGIDLHTWDRVFLDLGPDFAYLTVPGKGCVNAAPRIATIQGETSAGNTSIYHDGVEIFV